MPGMLRQFVLRSPLGVSVACVVLCSVGGSVGAMLALGIALDMSREWMFGRALAIAICVPSLVSLPVSLVIIRLLHEVEEARGAAQRLAWNDELTGSLNRRRFAEMVRRELIGAERTGQPLTVALLDLDDFKQINDRYGHAAGDAVLRAVATATQASLRATDLSARWGGEEFAIALPGADVEQAVIVSQRVRAAISELRVSTPAGDLLSCTASIGIAERGDADETLDELFSRADRAMYRAKQSGKNRVMLADQA
jgi:diguanylate cyclase (GGDEF)-like protein